MKATSATESCHSNCKLEEKRLLLHIHKGAILLWVLQRADIHCSSVGRVGGPLSLPLRLGQVFVQGLPFHQPLGWSQTKPFRGLDQSLQILLIHPVRSPGSEPTWSLWFPLWFPFRFTWLYGDLRVADDSDRLPFLSRPLPSPCTSEHGARWKAMTEKSTQCEHCSKQHKIDCRFNLKL